MRRRLDPNVLKAMEQGKRQTYETAELSEALGGLSRRQLDLPTGLPEYIYPAVSNMGKSNKKKDLHAGDVAMRGPAAPVPDNDTTPTLDRPPPGPTLQDIL
ncbi:hypothetical protein NDU88_009873 [Pleurodeles waltl]|uniref:Uncharacterized protein n=1 Tax=Pleurodeles waltl TaxID=8319 RepID=A0AAV7QST3_PLEWA|nr:hypothetical protein NDU88_009873 [Pleurodeles waltl]